MRADCVSPRRAGRAQRSRAPVSGKQLRRRAARAAQRGARTRDQLPSQVARQAEDGRLHHGVDVGIQVRRRRHRGARARGSGRASGACLQKTAAPAGCAAFPARPLHAALASGRCHATVFVCANKRTPTLVSPGSRGWQGHATAAACDKEHVRRCRCGAASERKTPGGPGRRQGDGNTGRRGVQPPESAPRPACLRHILHRVRAFEVAPSRRRRRTGAPAVTAAWSARPRVTADARRAGAASPRAARPALAGTTHFLLCGRARSSC